MRITVVTVTLNCAEALRATIESVQAQRNADIEYIVVDGASTDGTREVVRQSSIVGTFLSEPDRGIYDAMNKGFRLAKGDAIGFLNAGDVFASSETVATIAHVFEDPEVDVCYGDLAYARGRGVMANRFWTSGPFRPGLFLTGWMPPHPGFFVRRGVYERFGGFDTRYRISADYDFMLRVLELGRCRERYLATPLVVMEQGGASTRSLRAIASANWECLKARTRNGMPAKPHLLITKPLSKLLQLGR